LLPQVHEVRGSEVARDALLDADLLGHERGEVPGSLEARVLEAAPLLGIWRLGEEQAHVAERALPAVLELDEDDAAVAPDRVVDRGELALDEGPREPRPERAKLPLV